MKRFLLFFTGGVLAITLLTCKATLTVEAEDFALINNTATYRSVSLSSLLLDSKSIIDFTDIITVAGTEDVLIYSIADKNSEVIGRLSPHTIGSIINEVNEIEEWTQISSGNILGYVDSSLIVKGDEAKTVVEYNCDKLATVITSVARIYELAGSESKLLYVLPSGSELSVFDITKDWIGVLLNNGQKGYVQMFSVSLSINLKTAKALEKVVAVAPNITRTIIALPPQENICFVTPYDTLFSLASVKSGVPVNLLKSVAKNESGFNEKSVSSAGAIGVMQLMESTAIPYGCMDRYDAKSNIMAGALYLSSLIAKYKDIELVLAAYNAGPASVDKYGGIPPFIETQNFVVKVMNSYCSLDINNEITVNSIIDLSFNNSSIDPLINSKTSLGSLVALYACRFVGNDYVWGGNDLENGIDCSGFVKEVYAKFGVELPRYSVSLRNVGRAVNSKFEELLAGDIICYEGHVAIYLGNGRGIVHAAGKDSGIIISPRADYRPIITVRRIF